MSFVLRLSALNCENKQNKEALLKESITKAKLAVTQKPKYSFALFCLGMSYFYYYFNSENSRDLILVSFSFLHGYCNFCEILLE